MTSPNHPAPDPQLIAGVVADIEHLDRDPAVVRAAAVAVAGAVAEIDPVFVEEAADSSDGSLRVDIWETAEDYQNFVENRLVPGMASLGLTREPLVEIYPAHAVYLPDNAPAD